MACVLCMVILTARRGPRPTTRPAFWSVFPFFVGAFCSLGIASIVNLVNTAQAAQGSGLALYTGDTLNVTLGLFGSSGADGAGDVGSFAADVRGTGWFSAPRAVADGGRLLRGIGTAMHQYRWWTADSDMGQHS